MPTETATIRVLLIDDHALFRESWPPHSRQSLGLRSSTAPAFGKRLRCSAGSHFDLVLLDHDLGNERASQFLPAARQNGYRRPRACGDRLGERHGSAASAAAGSCRNFSQEGPAQAS